ncbi:conserved hypothetical protein [Histoplasma capsulatum var. duboisii H88]|uniref:Uncharacterized protein n=4 Tax=Ajellomycetaceae TaxID=299071 RepID=F0UWD1_AJEC8|nr:conserved hypothetical protein [Histoplasma capsulatum H143]EGC42641.1 conserved hypothetical protein [Histoplasma capsulatum var. duboisii H88]KKZ63764.1 hypothetical protein EMCG_00246 [Emmonsia crescens UAMH 3008]OJD10333.1 hypothetical protein AJ78_08613 [Emergomyces pasteurianus Ep9510]QSS48698.1 hypothetical protein I7I53_08780 [Histoplasma capsulatum var. duboisii H88]
MFARLINTIAPPSAPSALLVVGKFGATIHVLHLVPEDGAIERFSLTTPPSTTTFRRGGATELAREQIGVVTLHVGDGETTTSFLNDIETRARKLWDSSLSSSPSRSVGVIQLVQDVLQPAALDAIREKEGRDRSMNATQMYPVFVVRIARSRAGRILTEPTSFPQ